MISDLWVRLLRRWLKTREEFHDWMWSGGDDGGLARAIARRLPHYFSDPYWISNEEFQTMRAKGSLVLASGSPWVTFSANSTTGTSSTVVWTTNTNWDKREGDAMMTGAFWGAVVERALKTFVQTLLALWATNDAFDITKVNLPHALALAGSAAVLSLLTSLASASIGSSGPSVASERVE